MLVESGRLREGMSVCCVEFREGCFSVHLEGRVVFCGLGVLGWLYEAITFILFA